MSCRGMTCSRQAQQLLYQLLDAVGAGSITYTYTTVVYSVLSIDLPGTSFDLSWLFCGCSAESSFQLLSPFCLPITAELVKPGSHPTANKLASIPFPCARWPCTWSHCCCHLLLLLLLLLLLHASAAGSLVPCPHHHLQMSRLEGLPLTQLPCRQDSSSSSSSRSVSEVIRRPSQHIPKLL